MDAGIIVAQGPMERLVARISFTDSQKINGPKNLDELNMHLTVTLSFFSGLKYTSSGSFDNFMRGSEDYPLHQGFIECSHFMTVLGNSIVHPG